jgi:hypothetical protein
MESFEYNWSNRKKFETLASWIAKIETLVFKLKNAINFRRVNCNFSIFWGEITLYPSEVSTHFHFCLQSLKCDTLPP